MQIVSKGRLTAVDAVAYHLELAAAPETSYLRMKGSGRLFGFVAGGDCCAGNVRDNASDSAAWRVESQKDAELLLVRAEKSTLWSRKEFCVLCREDSIECFHRLSGDGALDEVRFFRQCFDDVEYGFAGDVDEVYSVAPNFREQSYYHPAERVIISYGNDLGLESGGHALASVPHVVALHDRRDRDSLVVGALAQPGSYDWDDFVWNPPAVKPPTDYIGDAMLGGGFALRYGGHKEIHGGWVSPRLVLFAAESETRVLGDFCEYAYRYGLLPRPRPFADVPAWWSKPIYCTWHDQTALSRKNIVDYHVPGPSAGEFCTRKLTDEWIDLLTAHDCKPGTVILDDKWQQSKVAADPDPVKWPDMRGWVEKCHRNGIRVFLWNAAWHNEDIPLDEAITRDGEIVCGDITNPRYERRFREMIRRYFSADPDGLNADGIKMDGLLGLPVGRGLRNAGGIWGLELQKYFLEVLYDEAKKTKPEACVSTFCANPYLAEYSDMVRLADMYSWRLTARTAMAQRAAVYHATMPYALIDTDGQFQFHQSDDYVSEIGEQAALGIPTLYNAEYLRRGRFFFHPEYGRLSEHDYAEIARVFAGKHA